MRSRFKGAALVRSCWTYRFLTSAGQPELTGERAILVLLHVEMKASHLLNWLPVFALCGVALVQVVRVQATALTRWKGGGFGMFSTIDSAGDRAVSVQLRDHSGSVLFLDTDFPSQPEEAHLDRKMIRQLMDSPSDRHSRLIAKGIFSSTLLTGSNHLSVFHDKYLAGNVSSDFVVDTGDEAFRSCRVATKTESRRDLALNKVDVSECEIAVLRLKFDPAERVVSWQVIYQSGKILNDEVR